MFENYLDFFYTNESSIMDDENYLPPGGFGIRIDDNGVEILGGVDENTPDKIIKLFDSIKEKVDSLKENGQFQKLTSDDIDRIISNIFEDSLGEPDIYDESNENGVIYEKKSWYIGEGMLSRTIIKPKTEEEIKKLDKNSLEYLEFKLQEAIDSEDYEKAAKYRDKINIKKSMSK